MKLRYIIIGLLFVTYACREIEDAPLMNRSTFARFYEEITAIEGVIAEPNNNGFIMLTNSISDMDTTGYVVQTDVMGNILWKTAIPGIILKSLVSTPEGYFIVGDSIKVDSESEEIVDLIVYSTQLYKISTSGTLVNKITITDYKSSKKIDYKSSAVTTNSQNHVILLGTFLTPTLVAKEKPFIISFDPSTLDTLWAKTYDIIDRDYVNCKSVHATHDGHITWASAILKEQQNFDRSYIAIPFVKEESTFENNDVLGETTDQRLYAGDMCPAEIPEFGFGVVGTFSTPGGENANILFARVNSEGSFILGSERFFDGQLSANNTTVDSDQSASQDTGDAITSTQDGGFVMAGTMLTTPVRGNGGKDIFIVKVDAFGNMLWNKVMGGTSDEAVSSIRETEDGGLLICGTKDAGGLPVVFLIKTNKDGEIIN